MKKYKLDIKDRRWKEKNKEYLKELQIFFDKTDSIKDNEIRNKVVNQMMICDEVLTKIAEDRFTYFYNKGYKNAK